MSGNVDSTDASARRVKEQSCFDLHIYFLRVTRIRVQHVFEVRSQECEHEVETIEMP